MKPTKSISVREKSYHKVEEEIKKNRKQHITPEDMEMLMLKIEDFYNNNPCSVDVFKLSKIILKRLRSDRDFYAVIEGVKGTGKSNFLLLLLLVMSRYAGYYQNKDTGQIVKVLPRSFPVSNQWKRLSCSFDFDNNLSFLDQVKHLKDKFNSVDRYGAFGIDEGSKNLHKHNWQSKIQFKLVQLSDTERWQNKAFFICIPNFLELNTTFRNDRIRMRIYLYVRYTKEDYASATISLRDPSRWSSDPWFIEENAKRFEYILRRKPVSMRTPEDIIRAERKLKGFAGEVHIPSLKTIAPKIWEIYMKYKIANAQRELQDEVEEETIDQRQNRHYKYAIKKLMAFIKLKYPTVRYADFSKLTTLPMNAISTIWKEDQKVNDQYELLSKANEIKN